MNGATYFRKSLRGKSRWQSLLPHQISFAQFCRVAIYLCPFFFFFLHFVWYHWWLWRARASLTRRHICTHFCEHLALNCAVTLSTSGTGIFCLSCDIWLFGQTSKPCASLHASAPTARTHTRITLTEPFLLNTHPSIQPHTHTHTHTHIHSCGYYQRCSAEASGLSGPHGVAVTRGGRAYLGPRPLPRPRALAPGAGRQMPCRPPVWHVSVAKAYSV